MRVKKLLSLIMALMIVLGTFTFGFSVGLPHGTITVDKTAEKVQGTCDEWDITLTIDGVNGDLTSDTVLVIDRSGSMDNNNKYEDAIAAAEAFVNMVFDNGNGTTHRIAIISYAGKDGSSPDVVEHIGFSDNRSSILTAIGNIPGPSGGTHTQAAMKEAGELIDGSSADIQSIILLSDGRATYSFGITGGAIDYSGQWTTSSQPGYDYDVTVGDGNRNTNDPTPDHTSGNPKYYRHGASAIQETGWIKSGVDIYTISVDNDAEGDWTLEGIADSGNAYKTSDSGYLSTIYAEIAARILFAATEAEVTDPIGPYFDIPGINGSNYEDKISVNVGELDWDNTNEVITWTIGTISELLPSPEMTYRVKMIPDGYGMTNLPTNKTTTLDYKDMHGSSASKNFPIPEVTATCMGELIIDKHVKGDLADGNDEFMFDIKDQSGAVVKTVTASGINDVSVKLLPGDYTVVETFYNGYVPDYTVTSASIVNGKTTTVDFYNTKSTIPGELVIDKVVTGDKANGKDVFTFEVKLPTGEYVTTVTASGIQNGSVMLTPGAYVVVETGYMDYTPSYTTTDAAIGPDQTTTVYFYNSWETQPGKLIIDKEVTGDLSDPNDEFTFEVKMLGDTVKTVTATAMNNGEVMLMPGTYVVEETVYGDYAPMHVTQQAVIVEEGTTTASFINDKSTKYGDVIVHKAFSEGSATTDMAFDYKIATNSAIDETSPYVVLSSVAQGTPDGPHKLEVGTYYIGEKPYEGWIMPADQQFAVVEGQTTHVTLTNTAIEDGMLIVHKDVPNIENDENLFYFKIYRYWGPQEMELLTSAAITEDQTIMLEGLEYGEYLIEEDYDWMYMQDKDSEMVTLSAINPSDEVTFTNTKMIYDMTIEKTVDDDRVKRNVDVTYTVVITNTGNQEVWFDYVDDDGEDLYVTEDGIYLAPGESTTMTHITSYGSTGDYENVATATYYEYEEIPVSISDSAIVEVYKSSPRPDDPKMTITKEADDDDVMVGDLITYTITVKNTGDERLEDILVYDPLLDFEETIDYLSVGESVSFTVEHEATEEGVLENTAYAEDNEAPNVEDDERVVVNDKPPRDIPGLAIDKSISSDKKADFEPGEMVEFKLVVTNTGETDLVNVVVEDNLGGYYEPFTVTIPELLEGESEEIFVSMYIPAGADDFLNVATATTGDLEAEDDELVTIAEEEIEIIEMEEEIPLAVPDAGAPPMFMIYGLAALATGLGFSLKKRR